MSTLSTLEANSLKGALEALLLVSSDPVSAPALAGALDIAPGECASLLAELKVEYEEANRGFQLREVAGGWRLFTHPAYHDVVEALCVELGHAKAVAGGARNLGRHRIPPARDARGGQGHPRRQF